MIKVKKQQNAHVRFGARDSVDLGSNLCRWKLVAELSLVRSGRVEPADSNSIMDSSSKHYSQQVNILDVELSDEALNRVKCFAGRGHSPLSIDRSRLRSLSRLGREKQGKLSPAHTQVKSAMRIPLERGHLDHTDAFEFAEPRSRKPQPSAQYLLIMLSQGRRGAADLPWRRVVLERRAGILVRSRDRMRYVDEKAARLQMLGAEQVAHRRHRCERDPPRLYLFVEIEYGLLADPFFEETPERLPVIAALQPVRENFLARPLGIAHHVDEVLPLMLLDAAQENPAVFALHRFHWLNRLATQPRRDHSHVRPELEGQFEDARQRLLHRHFDVLTLAVAQLCEHRPHRRYRRMDAALEACLVAEGLERRHFGMLGTAAIEHAGAARRPHREFLSAPVAMSSGEPERLDGGHHEPRIQFPETFVVQSDTIHIRRPNVVNQNVGLRNHPLENRETLGPRNVERDAEFVGVEIEKQAALLGMGRVTGKGPTCARTVADTGAFHLDHFGAHIGHQLGRVWRRNHLADFDDFETC